jgi:hypothetical protein
MGGMLPHDGMRSSLTILININVHSEHDIPTSNEYMSQIYE